MISLLPWSELYGHVYRGCRSNSGIALIADIPLLTAMHVAIILARAYTKNRD